MVLCTSPFGTHLLSSPQQFILLFAIHNKDSATDVEEGCVNQFTVSNDQSAGRKRVERRYPGTYHRARRCKCMAQAEIEGEEAGYGGAED